MENRGRGTTNSSRERGRHGGAQNAHQSNRSFRPNSGQNPSFSQVAATSHGQHSSFNQVTDTKSGHYTPWRPNYGEYGGGSGQFNRGPYTPARPNSGEYGGGSSQYTQNSGNNPCGFGRGQGGSGRGQGGRTRHEYVRVRPEQPNSTLGTLPIQDCNPEVAASIPAYPSKTTPETPVSELRRLEISPVSQPVSMEITGRMPVERPDSGGKSCRRSCNLLVNHFPVDFSSELTILHYVINIEKEMPPGHKSIAKISKSDALLVKNKLFSDDPAHFPISATGYDGEKNIYSAVELPVGVFRVEVSKGEDDITRAYKFTTKLVKQLDLSILRDYLQGSQSAAHREILQAMDVILKENPSKKRFQIGRCFYNKEMERDCDLGWGIMASRGFQQSLKPTIQGIALCMDFSVITFRKCVPVLEFLSEHLDIHFNEKRILTKEEWGWVAEVLKELRVTVTHRKTNQKYSVCGLTINTANDQTFPIEDLNGLNPPKEVGIVDYYLQKYGKRIMYRHLPCLDLSKNKRMNYVPMEFCVLVEGQKYPKELLDRETAQYLKKMALTSPKERKKRICNMVRASDGPCGENMKSFQITVSDMMTEVTGRVLSPPDLKLGDSSGKGIKFQLQNEDCQWNLVNRRVPEGRQIERWAILDFSSSSRPGFRVNLHSFVPSLVNRAGNLGIRMKNAPLFTWPSNMNVLSNCNELQSLLKKVYEKANRQLHILICVMANQHPGYKNLKRICETEIGIITQCCLSSNINKNRDQYFANLALKINAKLGGSNAELYDTLPRLNIDSHVMFMGADVNHPSSRNTSSPSIAAVVASMNWPGANSYAARFRPQPHRKEKIQDLGEMCRELLDTYGRINTVKPSKIMFFRDGVSESQFDMVLNEELADIKKAIESDGYSPSITLVVAQKRHLTRLFPRDEKDGVSKTGNVFPGTVVDTTIVHQREFDFYLCSHNGSLGTSKATHYHVLWDEHGFSSDELQRIIYNLCYTFARCTKPVSLVPPVYYADIAAYRGRLYYEGLSDFNSPALTTSSSSSFSPSSSSSSSSFPACFDYGFFPKLHSNVKSNMFFC